MAIPLVVVAACGGDDDDTAVSAVTTADGSAAPVDTGATNAPASTETSGSTETSAATATSGGGDGDCSGEPIKLMNITSLTGAIANPAAPAGADAAAQAINEECALGRPIEFIICDDESDPNVSQECGRRALEEGILAFVGNASVFTDTANALTDPEGIPNFANFGTTTAELTSPVSFPVASSVAVVVAESATIVAAGGSSVGFVAPDIPQFDALADAVGRNAESLGGTLDERIRIPADATDYSQFAAQASSVDGIAQAAVAPQHEAFLNALVDAGFDFGAKPFVGSPTFGPEIVAGFDGAIDGAYTVAFAFPPSATDNAGIAQFLEEMDAAGVEESLRTGSAIVAWRAMHWMAEDVLPSLDTIDSASIVEYLNTATFESPETIPVDYNQPAFPDDELLSGFRLFSSAFIPWKVVDGEFVAATEGFVSSVEPFEITAD